MKTNSFLTRFIRQLSDSQPGSDAQLIADSLSYHPNLSHWLATSVAVAGSQAAPMLARSAQFMRDEMGDFATATHLDRMATNPALVRAVIRELPATTSTTQHQPNLMPAI